MIVGWFSARNRGWNGLKEWKVVCLLKVSSLKLRTRWASARDLGSRASFSSLLVPPPTFVESPLEREGGKSSQWGSQHGNQRVRKSWPPFRLLCLINNIHREGLPNGFFPLHKPSLCPVSIFLVQPNSRQSSLFRRQLYRISIFYSKTIYSVRKIDRPRHWPTRQPRQRKKNKLRRNQPLVS